MGTSALQRSHLVILTFTSDPVGMCYYIHVWNEKQREKTKVSHKGNMPLTQLYL